MTNQLTMDTMGAALRAADTLARRDDRFAFFAALIVLGGVMSVFVYYTIRYLVRQNTQLGESLNSAHQTYAVKLETIVKDNHSVLNANTEATVKQVDLLRRLEDRELRKASA